MGKHKPSSKSKKPQAKSAHKPVKKTAPKPTQAKAKKAQTNLVANKPNKSSAGAKPSKAAAKAVTPPPKAKTAPPAPAPAKGKAKADPADPATEGGSARNSPDELRKQLVAKAKSRNKPQRAAAFTLDDVRGELARAKPVRKEGAAPAKPDAAKPAAAANPRLITEIKPTHRRFGAASLADILGYDPAETEKPEDDESLIDKKFIRFYKLLVQLRDHVKSGLAMHEKDTLKRSNREDAGDLSGYGQHMADAGTDAFDRDFALSLVSNEQEALFEVEEAIKRIKKGTYGMCELTGKPIDKERLLAVPFARYSVESQAEVERTKRRSSNRAGLFGEVAGEEGAKIVEDDGE